MNITMNRAELLSAAQRAAAIAPEDSPVEALRGTLLEANAATGALTLTATNLETALEQSLSCPTAEDDALVVDAKLLAGMLERLPGDTVELKRTPGVPVLSLLNCKEVRRLTGITGAPKDFRRGKVVSLDAIREDSGLYQDYLAA